MLKFTTETFIIIKFRLFIERKFDLNDAKINGGCKENCFALVSNFTQLVLNYQEKKLIAQMENYICY